MALFAIQIPAFLSGMTFGLILLCLGLGIGHWLGRRRGETGQLQDQLQFDRVAEMMNELARWTNDVSGDVTAYKTVVDDVTERFGDVAESEQPAKIVGLLSQIVQANQDMQHRLETAESTLQTQAQEIASYMAEARTDALTSLPNRRAFDDEISRRFATWQRHGTAFFILIVDIDHFKMFNDRYGHLVGDSVLAEVARCLRETLRESDLVARYGGEEFAVLLPNQHMDEAIRATQRTREAIESAEFESEGRKLKVTVSCGLAQSLPDESLTDLIKRADKALYSSKRSGRNAAHWHDGNDSLLISPSEEPAPADSCPNGDSPAIDPDPEFALVRDDLRQKLIEVTS